MDTPALRNKVKELQSVVSPYSNGSIASGFFGFSGFSGLQEYISSPKIYLILPIAIFFLLLFSRPTFVYEEVVGKRPQLSIRKLLVFWLVISVIVDLGIFGYNYKR